MAIQEGKRIYIESLLSATEYKEMSKKYPSCYNYDSPAPFFNSEFNWRWRMGGGYTPAEITEMNARLEAFRNNALKQNAHPEWMEIDI